MFNINGEYWRVLLVSPNHPQLYRQDGIPALGVCNDLTKTIYINDEVSSFMRKKILCHEITHAAMFSYNINLTLEQEELLADLVATYGQEIVHITNMIFNRIKKR